MECSLLVTEPSIIPEHFQFDTFQNFTLECKFWLCLFCDPLSNTSLKSETLFQILDLVLKVVSELHLDSGFS